MPRGQLLELRAEFPFHVVISFTRHQGFLLGRGNQQLSPELIQSLDWKQDVTVLGSRSSWTRWHSVPCW